jgi:hypothetical protein
MKLKGDMEDVDVHGNIIQLKRIAKKQNILLCNIYVGVRLETEENYI